MTPLLLSLAVAISPAFTASATMAPTGPSDDLRVAADSFVALTQGNGRTRAWPDLSDSARIANRLRSNRVGSMLASIPRAALADDDERLLLDNLTEVIAGRAGTHVCRTHLWYAPSQFNGWHISASNWARNVRVGDAASRDRALAALRELPAFIADERTLVARGLDSGYVSSQQVIATAIRQFRDLTTDDVAASPLAAPITRDTSAAFRDEFLRILREQIFPAARDYSRWLETSYLPQARRDGSLSQQPEGIACYRALLRQSTSVDSDPESLMADARTEIDRVRRALEPSVRALTGAAVSDGIRLLKSDPRFVFPSRDSTLAAYRAMTAQAARLAPRVVAGFEPESIAVIPYPEFQERAGVPPSYQRAPDDHSRPAWFLVNLGRPERMAVGNAVAHEAYPGHHLQRIAASRATSIHPVMRTIGISAFSEGWGIYAEGLGAEMALYATPLDSIGQLVHLLDVAVAYYLDAGAHLRGWTRTQLVDSMFVLGGRTRVQAGDYADRHAALPGQLATYFVGYRVILAARAGAARRLGKRFDLARFNREVIRDGTITLASLQEKLDRWVERELSTAPRP
ncbi:MAG: DUF885 domain-containing protein [Gemmatimonadaceae bacterium]|nr:DUF885 domain-containing protein [Gemmatimonadaceae bacterium]